MKLNLLPTYVSRERQAKIAWIFMILICLGSVGMALAMISSSQDALKRAKDEHDVVKSDADKVAKLSSEIPGILAPVQPFVKHIALAEAMNKHNTVYPDFYKSIFPYIPGFFRVTAVSAKSTGPDTVTLTLNGILRTNEQYADLMLAMLRNPEVTTVTRAGYTDVDSIYVPQITAENQKPMPYLKTEGPVPTDPLARLQYLQSKGTPPGQYLNQGGFGTGVAGKRGAMPKFSTVTVTVYMKHNLQTPDPRATLGLGGGTGARPGFPATRG